NGAPCACCTLLPSFSRPSPSGQQVSLPCRVWGSDYLRHKVSCRPLILPPGPLLYCSSEARVIQPWLMRWDQPCQIRNGQCALRPPTWWRCTLSQNSGRICSPCWTTIRMRCAYAPPRPTSDSSTKRRCCRQSEAPGLINRVIRPLSKRITAEAQRKVPSLRPDQHATELMNVAAGGETRSEIGPASEVVGCTHVLHCEFQHGSN